LTQQISQIDAIAVTYGPGLIGSLLVGVETAKTLALAWNKPLLPINHLIGHYYANWISQSSVFSHQFSGESLSVVGQSVSKTDKPITAQLNSDNRQPKTGNWKEPEFPCIGLLVSGGHTDLVLFKSHNKYLYIGGTRDDAAGECFDKCARLLGYPYPGGPKISQLAKEGNPKKFTLPLPMSNSHDFDFSFSGLKTAFLNLVKEKNIENDTQEAKDLCATLENTIVKSLVKKTIKAARENNVSTIIVGGGVSANQKLREELRFKIQDLGIKISLHFPELKFCGDNAAMIAAAAFFANQIDNIIELQANPNLSL
jgi:N6-L-threonylcarbamoyladenine synthase